MSSTAAQRQAVLRALRHDKGTPTDKVAEILVWKHWEVQPVIIDLAAEGLVRRGEGGWQLPAPAPEVLDDRMLAGILRRLLATGNGFVHLDDGLLIIDTGTTVTDDEQQALERALAAAATCACDRHRGDHGRCYAGCDLSGCRSLGQSEPEAEEQPAPRRRFRECAEAFGQDGEYHPSCCRFPKSCSPYPYQEAIDAGNVPEDRLEPPQ